MDESQVVFSLFEGACPGCGREGNTSTGVTATEVGGTASFIEEYSEFVQGDPEKITKWASEVGGVDGSIHFICPEGHTFSVEHSSITGDWMA